MGRPDNALAELDTALALQPDLVSCLDLQRQLLSSLERWDAVEVVLDKLADRAEDVALETGYRLARAAILEHRLNRGAEATDVYVRAAHLAPGHRGALMGAERGLASEQRWHELYSLMVAQAEALSDTRQIHALYCRAGILAAERLSDTPAAVRCLEAAHALVPQDLLPL